MSVDGTAYGVESVRVLNVDADHAVLVSSAVTASFARFLSYRANHWFDPVTSACVPAKNVTELTVCPADRTMPNSASRPDDRIVARFPTVVPTREWVSA